MIHLEKNTKKKFGFASPNYVKNKGIEKTTGKYVAFCDDDDIWFPHKIEIQLKAMKETGCKMSCTDGLVGKGVYCEEKNYKKYNAENYYKEIKQIYKKKGSKLMEKGFPDIWDYPFLKVHNCVIGSSVIMKKVILSKIKGFKNMKPPEEDHDCWLRALKHSKFVYIKTPCFYYNIKHGDGQNW